MSVVLFSFTLVFISVFTSRPIHCAVVLVRFEGVYKVKTGLGYVRDVGAISDGSSREMR